MSTGRTVRAVRLHPEDDVAVVLEAASPGDVIVLGDETVVVQDAVPRFHKVALRDLEEGSPVRKVGEVIGAASRPVGRGQHVHIHNLRSLRSAGTR
jgi:hypothetical protein